MASLLYANRETKRVHANTKNDVCRQRFLMKNNIVKFKTVEDAIIAGYSRCLRCKWPAVK